MRHFISTADEDLIYYAAEYDIYYFHIPSQKKQLLITLPFTPRCLAAGLGWICAGAENHGECAFIKIRGLDRQTDVDSRLPFDSGNLSSKTGRSTSSDIPFPELNPEMITEELGGLIVNSITIHCLAPENDQDAPETVAVISNNDQTVKIFSLLRRQQIAELAHPTCMNYATISPDTRILVAVGDDNRVFFYRREVDETKIAFFDGKMVRDFHWRPFARPKLPSDGSPTDDCCFTAAFSPTGHLCVVAAQNGMITVFDMKRLGSSKFDDPPESAILCTFRSSRPRGFGTGAVRSMSFSPEPWDLLLWAEEYGRVGIADVREAFVRRQIIKLETHAVDMERVTLEDLTNPELRELDPETRMLHQFRETIGLDDDERYSRRRHARSRSGQASLLDDGESLTERERQLIESIRTSRFAIDAADGTDNTPTLGQTPYSVNYTSSPRVRASLAQADENRSRSARLRAMMSQFMRTMDNDRSEERLYQPRRRSSVVLSQGTSPDSTNRLAPMSSARPRVTASPSRLSQNEMDLDETRPHSVSATLEASGAFSDNVSANFNSMDGPRDSSLLALLRRQHSELPDLQNRIIQQQQRMEQLQREMTAQINSAPHFNSWRNQIDAEFNGYESELAAMREIARSLEPFDPTGIPPEEIDTQRELYYRRRNTARDYATHVRHVLFAGENSSAQSSALPTTNLSSMTSYHQEILRTNAHARRFLDFHRENRERHDLTMPRPSTPSNTQQTNRNRSQSPTSRALILARGSAQAPSPPSTTHSTSYAEAADPSLRRNEDADSSSTPPSRPSRLTTTTANPASTSRTLTLTNSIRQARVMAMQSAAARMMDANGNWMAGDAFEPSISIGSSARARAAASTLGGSESWSERGVGTAGVGWSRDGRMM